MTAPTEKGPLNCERWRSAGICLALAAITFAVFGQTAGFAFVNFDDDLYVYENAQVAGGLSWKGLAWVFTHLDCHFYHPLTMLSLMVDYQLHGLHAGWYHLTNVLLHTASVILLFLILRQMTGAMWRSAFVAAVFAIHPLRVESVAWIAERKDVLGTFFFMLTLGAYVRYVRQPESVGRYLTVVGAFVLALLSKPTMVTLPFLLLVLDYWPLNRFEEPRTPNAFGGTAFGLALEKIPLLALAIGASAVTVRAEAIGLASLADVPMLARFGNAVVSYAVYLRQMVWPAGLAVFYPQPEGGYPIWTIALCSLLLLLISGGVLAFGRKRRWLLAGWLWYLGMLTPMIGLVQLGHFARADRFTYLPQIGIYLAATWLAAEWGAKWPAARMAVAGLMTGVLGVLMVCAWKQTAHWKNDETLWVHVNRCVANNFVGQLNLGAYLLDKGRGEEAVACFQKALQIKPDSKYARLDLGNALGQQKKTTEAIAQYQQVLQIDPNFAEARNNLGIAFFQVGKLNEAVAQFQQALQIDPNFVEAHKGLGNAFGQKGELDQAVTQYEEALQINFNNVSVHDNLGEALRQQGKLDEAIRHFERALQIQPALAETHYNLGLALRQKGKLDEAIAQYQKALEIKPAFAEAHNNLGNALLQKGRVDDALAHYQQALQINPNYADAHDNLGHVLLQEGRVDEAIVHYQQSLQIRPGDAESLNNLGNALMQKGRLDEAIVYIQKALEGKPDFAEAHYNLGTAFLQKGRTDDALTEYQSALQINPDYMEAHLNLGNILAQKGRAAEAIPHFQKALQIAPANSIIQNNLAWLLATGPEASLRDGRKAVELARQAKELTGGTNPMVLHTLAAAFAEVGQFNDAKENIQKAIELARAAGRADLVERFNGELKRYEAGLPLHQ